MNAKSNLENLMISFAAMFHGFAIMQNSNSFRDTISNYFFIRSRLNDNNVGIFFSNLSVNHLTYFFQWCCQVNCEVVIKYVK